MMHSTNWFDRLSTKYLDQFEVLFQTIFLKKKMIYPLSINISLKICTSLSNLINFSKSILLFCKMLWY